MTKSFDFDIQSSTTQVSGKIPPDGESEVNFQIRNSGDCLKRAEVILMPTSGPDGPGNMENLADWLQLVEPREYDYQPQSHRNYTAKIKITGSIVPGTYKFRLLVVGHDDPDNEYLESDEVSFNVALRRVKVLPFVIGGIVLLALLAIGLVIALRSGKPSPALTSNLNLISSSEKVTVGQPAEYQLELKNTFKETVAENVVMEYTYPEGVLGAWVEWEDEDEPATPPGISACGSTTEMLRCVFEKIEPQQEVYLKIYVLPGPLYPDQDISTPTALAEASSSTATPTAQTLQIDNKGRFTLSWLEDGEYQENLVLAVDFPSITLTPVDEKKSPVSGAAIPAVDIATVGLPVKISLVGWNNKERGGPVFFEYELPQGMRFASFPDECEQQIGNYSILHCTAKSEDPIDIQVISLQPSVGFLQILRGKEEETAEYKDLQTEGNVPSLSSAINQIVFNGKDDWAQLGYSGLPDTKEFTVEMWVNPYSLEDGQALIGAHRHSEKMKSVDNLFLVGYYKDSINVNVLGECRNLVLLKTTEPFHLAVVVKGYLNNNKRDVTVYKDKDLVETTIVPCCSDCKVELWDNPTDDEVDLNWIIGQDWDADGSDFILSDFFHGAISDVRIYERALTIEEVEEDMYLPSPLCVTGADCARPDLIGWWPLSQPSQSASGDQSECILPGVGELKDETTTDAPCMLVDLSRNERNGARSGGAWENKNAKFGDALAFKGSSALSLDFVFSNFTENATGGATDQLHNNRYQPIATPTPSNMLTLTPASSTTPTSPATSVTHGAGLKGDYYFGRDFNIPFFSRIDPDVNFNWDGFGLTNFSVRWTGYVKPLDSTCTFITYSNDGVKLTFNKAPIIIDWETHGEEQNKSPEIEDLNTDQWYPIKLEYFQGEGDASVTLSWKCGDQPEQIIPSSQLSSPYIATPAPIPPILTPTPTPTPNETETALKATQTALVATQTAIVVTETPPPTPVPPPEGNKDPKEPEGVPVTMATWIYVDAVPSKKQTILAASFNTDSGKKVRVSLGIDENGHVQVIYQNNGVDDWVVTTDEKSIPAGRWIHYAVVFWFDKSNGALSKETNPQSEGEPKIYLLLFRDGQKVKASPQKIETNQDNKIPAGLYLGGIGDINCNAECFTGRIDEIRIWNRALYKPIDNTSHISTEINFWRRLPGVAFDESVYWSFDDQMNSGTQTIGLCQNNACPPIYLTISGPSWVPNDLIIDYTE